MARQKKQQQHLPGPGMAPPTIPVLNEKAELVQDLTTRRMALQQEEDTARADLIGEIHTQVQKGNLKPQPKSDSDIVEIYKFVHSETGEETILKWGRKEGVKVNKAKKRSAAAEVTL